MFSTRSIAIAIWDTGPGHGIQCAACWDFYSSSDNTSKWSVSLDAINKYFLRSRDYIHAFGEAISGFQANDAPKDIYVT